MTAFQKPRRLPTLGWRSVGAAVILGLLFGCGSTPTANNKEPAEAAAPSASTNLPVSANKEELISTASITRGKSLWRAVRWEDLPGWGEDDMHQAWSAWIRGCERPTPAWQALCPDVRKLSIASAQEQMQWMRQRLQPYRVEAQRANAEGLLTGYFEPVLQARRRADAQFRVPLWQAPANLNQRRPWFTRQEIDTLAEAAAQLRGREIAYLADPVDALMVQIQGSVRLLITEADGSQTWARLAFAATNDQPYRSVGRWLLDQNLTRDSTWPGIKAWIAANPQRVQEMIWSNPRVVFFKEEVLDAVTANLGPRGAQGVPLTAGRSVAVDRDSIPLGTPLWMQTRGDALTTQRLVMAQDVGSAIVGGIRADYFVGLGDAAGELAGRLKQNLQLWAFWPKAAQ